MNCDMNLVEVTNAEDDYESYDESPAHVVSSSEECGEQGYDSVDDEADSFCEGRGYSLEYVATSTGKELEVSINTNEDYTNNDDSIIVADEYSYVSSGYSDIFADIYVSGDYSDFYGDNIPGGAIFWLQKLIIGYN